MNLEKSTIPINIRLYILKASNTDNEKINNNTMIFKEGLLDSMGFLMLISHLEEEYGIKTGDKDLIEENFESINAISEFVDRKLQNP